MGVACDAHALTQCRCVSNLASCIGEFRGGACFRTDVTTLDLQPGGELIYTMTAEAPEQIAFMQQYGMPLATESRKHFTELAEHTHLAYRSLIDFVPDHEPYEHLTIVDLEPAGAGTRIIMQIEPLHDELWTQRLIDGRTNELANLDKLVAKGDALKS